MRGEIHESETANHFFDLDGTLLDHNKQVPKSAKEAIKELKIRGHEVAIATGRAPFMFKELREELEIHTYVSFNGQYVVVDGQEVFKNPLQKDKLKSLSEFALINKHPIVYQDHLGMKSTTELDHRLKQSVNSLKSYYPETDPLYFSEREIYQSWLVCKEAEEHPYISRYADFTFIRWHEQALDVVPTGGSKARGIEAVINHLGVHPDHVYAFGDELNDIEMLTSVKNSVAMGNASAYVKKAAKHVTKNVDEDGILHGLQLVGLLK
nr:Cof-type HAD-IIB family hydrolase [Anaerobacillus sp. CMMVII]